MRRLMTFVLGLALSMTMFAVPAQAAPPDHIDLDRLQVLLDGSPAGIEGYFLTVQGGPTAAQQSPKQVKMTVLAIADKSGPDGALIMFKADMTDPVMQNIGGIAAGMSGSPLYIKDGTDKVIGALSYGDVFTLDGLGLATPIEYMINTQNSFPPVSNSTLSLDRDVAVDGKTIKRVRVTTSGVPSQKAGTVTMRPLFGLRVSGVPQGSAVYKKLKKITDDKGVQLFSGGSGQCSQAAGYSAPYTAGGSIGAYYTLGSSEIGGYGTVTYVDGDTVMAFGHPMDWVGKTDLFATNVWMSGIWGSAMEPYKVGCAGQVQGALTQDRSAAIGVDVNATTVSTLATSSVSVNEGAVRTGSGETRIAEGTFTAGYGPIAAAIAVSDPVYRVANQTTMAGSATTATTVKVTGAGQSYTLTRPDVWSGSDVLGATAQDAELMVSLFDQPGLDARIESVDLQAAVDQSNRTASITSVSGGPIAVGQNTIAVTITPVGKAPVVIPVSITVPANAVIDSGVAVQGGADYFGFDEEAAPELSSLADVVKFLKELPTNNQIVVDMSDANGNPVRVGTANTDFYLQGATFPMSVVGALMADLPQAALGDTVTLMAVPSGLATGEPITLSKRIAGTTEWQTVGTTAIATTPDGMAAAVFTVTADASSTYRASWPGNKDYLGWASTTDVSVAPMIAIDGRRTGSSWSVTATSDPQVAGSPVTVQTKSGGTWKDVASATIGADGTAAVKWKAGPKSVKARAVLPASARLLGATSPAVRLNSSVLRINTAVKPNRAGNVTVALRSANGKAVKGVRFRVQRDTGSGWEPAANGSLRRTTRLWLANGDYRVTVPKQKRVPAQVREPLSVSSAGIVIRKATGGSGRARVTVLPPVPLRFTVQKLQAGQWLPVGGVRRISPPSMTWSRQLPQGRYRFAFPKQAGFGAATSDPVRVR